MSERVDLVVVGAGAAGLMVAIQAGRAGRCSSIVALEGARSLGAKILVAGGGRCNVTHDEVDESSYAGSSPNAIKKVLRRFGVEDTVRFFAELGVELKREDTGKLFPVSDRSRSVLDALLRAADEAGVSLRFPRRVTGIERRDDGFELEGPWGSLQAKRVVLAAGGKALPKSGSDGNGYRLAASLGHSVTERITPALVPLLLAKRCRLLRLAGLSTEAELEVRAGSGKRLACLTGSTLCTHLGLSGPGPMDVSRHLIDARLDDEGAALFANWLPGETRESLDAQLLELGSLTPLRHLSKRLPERLARTLCDEAGIEAATAARVLTRAQRKALVGAAVEMKLPVIGDRGFTHAEVTAGGVPLGELRLATMESRLSPGLHLCGEILDVDGRIGGYNFQWAWASGFVAGRSVDPNPA
jgi:predicted Rossmann fold flavoprotein